MTRIPRWIVHVAVPVIAAAVVNLIIYVKMRPESTHMNLSQRRLLPPGYIIAGVWTILLAMLGYAHFLTTGRTLAAVAIGLLGALCIAYPFITRLQPARLWNTLAYIAASATLVIVALQAREAVPYVAPLAMWAAYVTVVDSLGS